MKASTVWEKLRIENKKIVTSDEVKDLAEKIGKDRERTLYYLLEEDYLTRLFRGVFYVKSLEERKRGIEKYSIYELIGMALEEKEVERWYFGLETALKFNNMTHEYFNIDYALTDSYRSIKVIEIMDQKFQFFKRRKKNFLHGVKTKDNVKYSDPEKTVLDLIYRAYLNDENNYTRYLKEFDEYIKNKELKKYLHDYSKSFRKKVTKELQK
ncbi:MAG: type IV toxin-antitoxin system AbiEi family antitoxin domain-containing protein [Thermoplasmatota archaeon]